MLLICATTAVDVSLLGKLSCFMVNTVIFVPGHNFFFFNILFRHILIQGPFLGFVFYVVVLFVVGQNSIPTVSNEVHGDPNLMDV